MKARHEFSTDQEYKDYLKVYISALAMQGLLAAVEYSTNESYQASLKGLPVEAVEYTDGLLKALGL